MAMLSKHFDVLQGMHFRRTVYKLATYNISCPIFSKLYLLIVGKPFEEL